MSISKQTTIWCDGEECGQWVQEQDTAANIRRRLKRQGWVHVNGNPDASDFCPDCVSKGQVPAKE